MLATTHMHAWSDGWRWRCFQVLREVLDVVHSAVRDGSAFQLEIYVAAGVLPAVVACMAHADAEVSPVRLCQHQLLPVVLFCRVFHPHPRAWVKVRAIAVLVVGVCASNSAVCRDAAIEAGAVEKLVQVRACGGVGHACVCGGGLAPRTACCTCAPCMAVLGT